MQAIEELKKIVAHPTRVEVLPHVGLPGFRQSSGEGLVGEHGVELVGQRLHVNAMIPIDPVAVGPRDRQRELDAAPARPVEVNVGRRSPFGDDAGGPQR